MSDGEATHTPPDDPLAKHAATAEQVERMTALEREVRRCRYCTQVYTSAEYSTQCEVRHLENARQYGRQIRRAVR